MKKKENAPKLKKLNLKREAVRTLTNDELAHVAGASSGTTTFSASSTHRSDPTLQK